MPEALLLTLLGSRKHVLFVEGESDTLIYPFVYPEFTVVPRGSCGKVIETTKAFAGLRNLHGLQCFGIIDRDLRSEDEIASLREVGVFTTKVYELEDSFLLEEVLEVIERYFHFESTKVPDVKEFVLNQLKNHRDRLTSRRAIQQVHYELAQLNATARSAAELEQAYDTLVGAINPREIFQNIDDAIQTVLDGRDYEQAICLFDNKGLLAQVGQRIYDLPNFIDHIKRLLSSKDADLLIEVLRKNMPAIPIEN